MATTSRARRSMHPRTRARVAVALVATRRLLVVAAAVAYMLASVGALIVSDVHGLFGLHDTLAVPYARSSLVVEIAGSGVLVLCAVTRGLASPRGATS